MISRVISQVNKLSFLLELSFFLQNDYNSLFSTEVHNHFTVNLVTVAGASKRPRLKKIIKNWLLEIAFQFFFSAFIGYYSCCKK